MKNVLATFCLVCIILLSSCRVYQTSVFDTKSRLVIQTDNPLIYEVDEDTLPTLEQIVSKLRKDDTLDFYRKVIRFNKGKRVERLTENFIPHWESLYIIPYKGRFYAVKNSDAVSLPLLNFFEKCKEKFEKSRCDEIWSKINYFVLKYSDLKVAVVGDYLLETYNPLSPLQYGFSVGRYYQNDTCLIYFRVLTAISPVVPASIIQTKYDELFYEVPFEYVLKMGLLYYLNTEKLIDLYELKEFFLKN